MPKKTSKDLIQQARSLPLTERYKKLAKAADQRLVRLEAAARESGFKTATKWAYAKAARNIRSWGTKDPDHPRFNVKVDNLSERDLMARISEVEEFLESKTSTKQGIIEVYKKKADTLRKGGKNGQLKDVEGWDNLNITWEQLGELAQQGAFDKSDSSTPGSATILITMARYKRSKKDIIKKIKKTAGAQQHLSDKDAAKVIEGKLVAGGFTKTDAKAISKSIYGKPNMQEVVQVASILDIKLPGNKVQQEDLRQVANMRDIDWAKIL